MSSPSFFAELKRRNVYKVAVAYAVVAWLLVQVATQVFPFLEIPNWVVRLVIALVVIGFPIALVIAWAFESTPEGIKRTEIADSMPASTRSRKNAWIYIVVFGAAFSIGLFLIGRYTAQVGTSRSSAAGAADVPKSKVGQLGEPSLPVSKKSIAVLPFENLSEDKSATYFADGIQDQILTKLASIADLKVISRTSTARYKSKPEDLTTVSQQLGVANVLEGTVQKAGEKVRINVQLIDALADTHLWAKTYDRDIQDIFAVESEVAQEIADSLKAKLSPAEASTVASAPTKDAQAYDLFLKAEFEHRLGNLSLRLESFDQAATWYREAVARDPNFALAIAQLAICRLRRHWLVEPLSEPDLMEAGRLAKQALTLAPDLAEAHIALGTFHYYGFREYEPALIEFQRAIALQPNNSTALQFVAFVHRRQAKWQATLNELPIAMEKDPRDASLVGNLAQTYTCLRRWKEAEEVARHGLAIDPHESTSMRHLLLSSLNQTGSLQEPVRLLATFLPDDPLIPNSGSYSAVIGSRCDTFILARDFKAASKALETSMAAMTNEAQRLAAKVIVQVLAGDITGTRSNAEKVVQVLEARVHEHPRDIRSLRALSWVYLALGRKSDAVNIARQTVELLPAEKDAVVGPSNMTSFAEMQAQTGAVKEAVENLKKLLSIPAGETVSVARLKIDPVWDPIRNDPGFQQLLTTKQFIGP